MDGEWVDGNLFIDEKKDKHEILVGYVNYRIGWEVYPASVGQFTGLLDKNGTKIFEGDICRNTRNGEIVFVAWHGTMAGFVWSKREKDSCLFDFGELFRAHDEVEVIGNIYDNPELLRGE